MNFGYNKQAAVFSAHLPAACCCYTFASRFCKIKNPSEKSKGLLQKNLSDNFIFLQWDGNAVGTETV